jgi:hypothetical protein
MQVVGRGCEACGKRLAVSSEGAGCLECDRVFHSKCLKRPDTCPRCERSFDEQEERADRRERDQIAEQLDQGQTFVLLSIVLVLGVHILGAMSAISRDTGQFFQRLGSLALAAGMLMALWQGRSWARTLMLVLLGIGMVLAFLLGAARGGAVAFGGAVLGGAYATVFVLLLLPATRVFLEERRRLREGDAPVNRR